MSSHSAWCPDGRFWSSPKRTRHSRPKAAGFVHGSGLDPCTNPVAFLTRFSGRSGQLHNIRRGVRLSSLDSSRLTSLDPRRLPSFRRYAAELTHHNRHSHCHRHLEPELGCACASDLACRSLCRRRRPLPCDKSASHGQRCLETVDAHRRHVA